MRESDLKLLVAVGVSTLVAGVTWLLGPWALIVAGVLLLAATFFIDVKEE